MLKQTNKSCFERNIGQRKAFQFLSFFHSTWTPYPSRKVLSNVLEKLMGLLLSFLQHDIHIVHFCRIVWIYVSAICGIYQLLKSHFNEITSLLKHINLLIISLRDITELSNYRRLYLYYNKMISSMIKRWIIRILKKNY